MKEEKERTLKTRRSACLSKAECECRKFENRDDNGREAWLYAGRGTFYFRSSFIDSPMKSIAVPTKLIIKALKDLKVTL